MGAYTLDIPAQAPNAISLPGGPSGPTAGRRSCARAVALGVLMALAQGHPQPSNLEAVPDVKYIARRVRVIVVGQVEYPDPARGLFAPFGR